MHHTLPAMSFMHHTLPAMSFVHHTLPILFSKVERVVFLPSDPYLPNWLSDYGKLKPEGSVVLFFQGATDKPPSTVLPGGDNPDSQFALLKGIASIQAIGDPQEQADA